MKATEKAYSVADGHVLRGGDKIATYDSKSGLLDFIEGKAKYRAPAVAYLRKQGLPVEVTPDLPKGDVGAGVVSSSKPAASAGDEPGAPELPPPPRPAAAPILTAVRSEKDLRPTPVDPIKAKVYPDAPEMDPSQGDKTPEFVDWLYDNHPADAAKRYAGRKTHRE